MMKWLFGLLVLANVGLLMWGTWYRDPLAPLEAPQPRPAVAPEKLKLLSEPGARLATRAKTQASTSAEAATACYRLGPFASPDKTRMAGAKLDGWRLKYERVAEHETQGVAYRVYLPSFASKEVAEGQRRELTRLGFTDHALIVDEPGMENAISLGLFAVEDNAQARLQQLAQKGVQATVQDVPNMRPIYWLVLAVPVTDGKIGEVPVARFAEENWGTPGVTLAPAACSAEPPVTGTS